MSSAPMNVLNNFNNYFLGIVRNSRSCLGYCCCLALIAPGLFSGYAYAGDPVPDRVEPVSVADLFQVVLGLAFVLVVFAVLVYAFRRMTGGQPAGKGHLRVIDGLHIGSRERLLLVQIGDKQILLSVCPGNIQRLHILNKPVSGESESSQSRLQKSLDRIPGFAGSGSR